MSYIYVNADTVILSGQQFDGGTERTIHHKFGYHEIAVPENQFDAGGFAYKIVETEHGRQYFRVDKKDLIREYESQHLGLMKLRERLLKKEV